MTQKKSSTFLFRIPSVLYIHMYMLLSSLCLSNVFYNLFFLFYFWFTFISILFLSPSLLLFIEQMNASNSACMPFNGQLLTAASSIANVNNTSVNSRISAAVIGAPPVATVAVSVNVTPMNAAAAAHSNTVTPIFGTSPMISPTFIEHKYSANTFKQRFLANLRANHGGVSKTHLNNNNGSSNRC